MQPTSKIYTYNTPFPVYGLNWCRRPGAFRLGFGSFLEEYRNQIGIIELKADNQLHSVATTQVNYPITKLLWSPFKSDSSPDLFATTGDYLRIWEVGGVGGGDASDGTSAPPPRTLNCRSLLANRRSGPKRDFCAPLTSFDWNETDPALCVTSSVDTTCTVWNVETGQAKTQLIAHDKEVYDVAFARGVDIFASVGADGSVRMFDLRSLEHSTIIYETTSSASKPIDISSASSSSSSPLLRLAWNKQDPNFLATFQMDSNSVLILDIRVPAVPLFQLTGHAGVVNGIAWAPHSSTHLCSVGDDHQALVWDIASAPASASGSNSSLSNITNLAGSTSSSSAPQPPQAKSKLIQDPILAYNAETELNQLAWNGVMNEWIAVGSGHHIQALRV